MDTSGSVHETLPSKLPISHHCPKCGGTALWEERVIDDDIAQHKATVVQINYLCAAHKKASLKRQVRLVEKNRKLPLYKRKRTYVHVYRPLVDARLAPAPAPATGAPSLS